MLKSIKFFSQAQNFLTIGLQKNLRDFKFAQGSVTSVKTQGKISRCRKKNLKPLFSQSFRIFAFLKKERLSYWEGFKENIQVGCRGNKSKNIQVKLRIEFGFSLAECPLSKCQQID